MAKGAPMRSRNIKPGFFKNDALGECEPLARILFAGLWCLADRKGRVEHRSKKIKAELLPYDHCDIDDLLRQLAKKGFILPYNVDGQNYLEIVNFLKHQTPHIKEQASTIPAPDMHQTCTSNAALIPDSGFLIPDSGFLIPGKNPLAQNAQENVSKKLLMTPKRNGLDKTFAMFWEAYPKKRAKNAAFKSWGKINPDDQLLQTILTKVGQARASPDWQKDGGQFIPHPATWLNAGGWLDEYELVKEESTLDKWLAGQKAKGL